MKEHENVLTDMLLAVNHPEAALRKEVYTRRFKEYVRRFYERLIVLDTIDPELNKRECTTLITQFIDNVKQSLSKCKNRRYATLQLDTYNLTMETFVLPAFKEARLATADSISKDVVYAWKKEFPSSNLVAADFATIQKGFTRKFCYITTAVCETLGKTDDCYELNLLRDYRDHYLEPTMEGQRIVKEYYDIAPTIVKHINKQANAKEIYRTIYETYLVPSIHAIEMKDMEGGKTVYMSMVCDLKDKYFLKGDNEDERELQD